MDSLGIKIGGSVYSSGDIIIYIGFTFDVSAGDEAMKTWNYF